MSITIPTTKSEEIIGRLNATLTSDVIDGETLDTKVDIEGNCLCWIAGKDRRNFIKDINDVIKKYEI